MKKICCIIFGKYRKFKNHKTSIIFEKKLVFSIICSKSGNDDEARGGERRGEESIEVLKIIGLIKDI